MQVVPFEYMAPLCYLGSPLGELAPQVTEGYFRKI